MNRHITKSHEIVPFKPNTFKNIKEMLSQFLRLTSVRCLSTKIDKGSYLTDKFPVRVGDFQGKIILYYGIAYVVHKDHI
jgi:hypothetical protein